MDPNSKVRSVKQGRMPGGLPCITHVSISALSQLPSTDSTRHVTLLLAEVPGGKVSMHRRMNPGAIELVGPHHCLSRAATIAYDPTFLCLYSIEEGETGVLWMMGAHGMAQIRPG